MGFADCAKGDAMTVVSQEDAPGWLSTGTFALVRRCSKSTALRTLRALHAEGASQVRREGERFFIQAEAAYRMAVDMPIDPRVAKRLDDLEARLDDVSLTLAAR